MRAAPDIGQKGHFLKKKMVLNIFSSPIQSFFLGHQNKVLHFFLQKGTVFDSWTHKRYRLGLNVL